MQKKWIFASAVVLAAASAMPWFVGYLTEQQWQAATQEINRSQPFIQVDSEQYQRGFLGSDLQGSLVILNPETGESQQIAYRARITHGIIGSLMNFEPKDGWSPDNADWFHGEQPKLTLESRLWGSATLEFRAPAMDLISADSGESLTSSGGMARLSIRDAGSTAEALLKWPSLTLSGPDMNVRISDVYMRQNMAYLRDGIWTGNGEMRIASTRVEPAGQPAVLLQGLSVSGSSEASSNRERVSSSGKIRLEKVRWQGESYGPHQLTMTLDRLDVDSWSRLSESI
ncbi:MAG TPA: DUF945 family protein, partial [Marinobacter sp.]|nr:DUF945 family protein [Marinobacter sp.]